MTRPAVHLPEDLRQEIVDHCLAELPNEGCGLIAMDDERVVKVYPTKNLERSPHGYTVPPEEHFAALTDAESRGWELGGVFHSHPRGTAEPSMVDVAAALDPTWVYLVIGPIEDDVTVRAWAIRDGQASEMQLV